MRVQPPPQVVHHPLPDHVRQIGLDDGEDSTDRDGADHRPGQRGEETEVRMSALRKEGAVEDELRHQWGDHADDGADEDHGEPDRNLASVRAEQPESAPERRDRYGSGDDLRRRRLTVLPHLVPLPVMLLRFWVASTER